MRCDNCGCILTPGNTYGDAPHGIPLFVSTSCAKEMMDEQNNKETDVVNNTEK